MSFFTTNYENVDFEIVPEGEYECIISEVEKTTFSTGSEGLKVTLTIRHDVNQEGAKRKLFDNLVASPKAMFKFNQVSKAIGFPEGTSFNDISDFAQAIKFKPVRVKVVHEKYQGENRERVNRYMPASVEYNGNPEHGGTAGNPFNIPDEDFPFVEQGDIKPPWEE